MNLSIIGNPMEESIGRRSREERRSDRKKKREERKASGKPSRLKKVLLAVPRGAFLGLILLNVRGLASRLSAMNKKDPAKLKALWLRLGGDPVKFLNNIEKGAKKKRILGADIYNDNPIGFAIPAALGSAAPILVAINKFLKDNNIEIGQGESLDDITVAPGEEIDTNTVSLDAETPEAAAKQPKQPAGGTPETKSDDGFKFTPTTGLIIGAVVIGGYLLMKKKK